MYCLSFAAVCVLTIQIVIATQVLTNVKTGCFPCASSLNRQWRESYIEKCSGKTDDCGQCIEGYEFDNLGVTCKPKSSIIISQSGVAFIPNGSQVVTLTCKFSKPVDCVWLRRDNHLEIGGRYTYTNNHNDINTMDCSITIDPFVYNIDYGRWECTDFADSSHLASLPSLTTTLSNEKVNSIQGNNKNHYVPTGEIVIIKCEFQEKIDCAWTRRGNHLQISNRYTYLNSENDVNTKDCSIKISPIKDLDFGIWECHSIADSSHVSILSTSVNIHKIKERNITSTQLSDQKIMVELGNKTVLPCQFNAEEKCTWKFNSKDVSINGRYHFVDEANKQPKKDCSIEIEPFVANDVGLWECSYLDSSNANRVFHSIRLTTMIPAVIQDNPEITITNGIENSDSNIKNIKVSDFSTITCSIKNGNPAPQLHWKINAKKLESKMKIVDDNSNSVAISLQISHHKSDFEKGNNHITCIATLPKSRIHVLTSITIEYIDEGLLNDDTVLRNIEVYGTQLTEIVQDKTGVPIWIIITSVIMGLLGTVVLTVIITVWIRKVTDKMKVKSENQTNETESEALTNAQETLKVKKKKKLKSKNQANGTEYKALTIT